MKTTTGLLITIIIFTSCRKDEKPLIEPIPEPIPISYIVNTPGSYNIYECFEIDSLGQETSLGITDCTYVVGDTTINGFEYVHIAGTYFGNPSDWFYRDSSHFIINQLGKIQWTQNNIQDTLDVTYYYPNMVVYSILDQEATFDYPIGTWEGNTTDGGLGIAFDLQHHYYWTDGTPYTACDSAWIKHKKFADGIGEVMSQTAFISLLQAYCEYHERRLTYYYIAE
jgi:hypothetical protein